MKIIFPLMGLDNRGGCRVTVELANGLARKGHEVVLLIPRGMNQTSFPVDGGVIIREVGLKIPQMEDISSILRVLQMPFFLEKADVYFANYYLTAYPTLLAWILRRARHVVYLIQHYEPLAFGEAEKTFPRLKRWIAEQTYAFPFHQITVAEWIAKRIRKMHAREIRVIHPGLDESVFFPQVKQGGQGRKSLLVFPGRDRWKGFEDFLAAYQILKQKGLDVGIVASSAVDLGIQVPGQQVVHPENDQELANLYRNATVYVHPAWYEGCPLAPLEAMACGTPVVAAASEGILEYAVDGQNCLLASVHDPPALAEAIEKILADDALAGRLSQAGLETASQFRWEKMVDEMETFLLTLNAGHHDKS